ncbi:Protein transport protein yif1 [Savitreella phatthalungensis]
MYRPGGQNVGPGQGLYGQQPIYAPQPQHPVSVPPISSPPPHGENFGASPGANGYGGYGAYGQGFNEYLNAPAAQMGLQVGQSAVLAGQNFVNANVGKYVSTSALRRYFNVTNTYVLRKLGILLFPWRHGPWLRQRETSRDHASSAAGGGEAFADPRDDINAPDFYIPIMAVVTYILQNSLIAGVQGKFQADLFGETAGWAVAFLLVENSIIKFGCYLLSIPSALFLDLVAYSGYKYVGIILTNLVGLLGFQGIVYWLVFLYTSLACAFFVLRSLRSAILQGTDDASGKQGKARKVYFLASIALAQLMWMYLMLR